MSTASSSPTSPSSAGSTSSKAKRFKWNDDANLALVEIVRDEKPWAAIHGGKSKSWTTITARFAQCERVRAMQLSSHGINPPDVRGCIEHHNLLAKARALLDESHEGKSGASEEHSPFDDLLAECIALETSHTGKQQADKKAAAEQEQARLARQEDMRMDSRRKLNDKKRHSAPSSSSSRDTTAIKEEAETERPKAKALKLQEEILQIQREGAKQFNTHMAALTEELKKQTADGTRIANTAERSNDLFERWLTRGQPAAAPRE
jgi:hypothetical protein